MFSIFINDLPGELEKAAAGGVRRGACVVRCMMFADDVVMLADSEEGLRRCMEVVWAFSRRHRFEFNFGKDKTAVMVWGPGSLRKVDAGWH